MAGYKKVIYVLQHNTYILQSRREKIIVTKQHLNNVIKVSDTDRHLNYD